MSMTARALRGPLLRHMNVPPAAVVIGALALALGAAVVQPSLTNLVLALAIVGLVVGVSLKWPVGVIYGLTGWLVVLGTLRRVLDTSVVPKFGGLGDPLLLVEPAAMLMLAAIAAKKGAFRSRSRLANAVLVLNVLALLEVVNPLQGSPLVGAAGLLFMLVPMLAFWVGRSLVSDAVIRKVLLTVAILAIPAVVYGMIQQYAGLPSWDLAWVNRVSGSYQALNVGSAIRPFSSFSAASEYATFVGIGIAIAATGLTRRALGPVAVVAVGFLGFGLIFASSRGILVLTVLALVLMLAARLGVRPRFAVIIAAIALVLVVAIAHSNSGAPTGSTASAVLLQHQLSGLGNPFNSQDSTLSGHVGEMLSGLRSTIANPFGHGTGSVSLAATSFGGSAHSTEVDPSNIGVALGLPGLIAYLVVLWTGFSLSYRQATSRRSWYVVAALGVLSATVLQWTNGGQYAVAWLPWLLLGWLDASSTHPRESAPLAQFGQMVEPERHLAASS